MSEDINKLCDCGGYLVTGKDCGYVLSTVHYARAKRGVACISQHYGWEWKYEKKKHSEVAVKLDTFNRQIPSKRHRTKKDVVESLYLEREAFKDFSSDVYLKWLEKFLNRWCALVREEIKKRAREGWAHV